MQPGNYLYSGGSGYGPLSVHEGFAGVLLAAVACDGHVADSEVEALWRELPRMKLYRGWTKQHFNAVTDKLIRIFQQEGLDCLIDRSAMALPAELRETAFAGACDMVLADGVVVPAEKALLNNLTGRLGIEPDRAQMIAEVMIIRNRG